MSIGACSFGTKAIATIYTPYPCSRRQRPDVYGLIAHIHSFALDLLAVLSRQLTQPKYLRALTHSLLKALEYSHSYPRFLRFNAQTLVASQVHSLVQYGAHSV
jgi:hypothetical protein